MTGRIMTQQPLLASDAGATTVSDPVEEVSASRRRGVIGPIRRRTIDTVLIAAAQSSRWCSSTPAAC